MKTKHLFIGAIFILAFISIYTIATRNPHDGSRETMAEGSFSRASTSGSGQKSQANIGGTQDSEFATPPPSADKPNTHPLPEVAVKAVPVVGKVPDCLYFDKVGGWTNSSKSSPNGKMLLLEKEGNAYYYITDANDRVKMIVKLPSFFPGSCLLHWQWLDDDRVLGEYGSSEFIDEMPFWSKLCVYDIPTKQIFRLELPNEYDGSFTASVLRTGEVNLSNFRGRWTGTELINVPEELKSDEKMWFTIPPTSDIKRNETK